MREQIACWLTWDGTVCSLFLAEKGRNPPLPICASLSLVSFGTPGIPPSEDVLDSLDAPCSPREAMLLLRALPDVEGRDGGASIERRA